MLTGLNNYLMQQGLSTPLKFKDELMFDFEVYPNYCLVNFLANNEAVLSFAMADNQPFTQYYELAFICQNFTIVGFNSMNYDMLILRHLLSQKATNESLYDLSVQIVEWEKRYMDLKDKFAFNERIKIDHYDLIEVAPDPNKISLKMYSARLLADKLQDLPYDPHTPLNEDEMQEVYLYCIKDIKNTYKLRSQLKVEIEMREFMSKQFKMDLRSLSDAQIGERVVVHYVEQALGRRLPKPMNYRGKILRYTAPDFIHFDTPYLQHVLKTVNEAEYKVEQSGKPTIPDCVKDLDIVINKASYTLGIGGLHSKENAQTVVCDENHRLRDIDVDSFYPRIIINNRYAPQGLESVFLDVYENSLVSPRLEHKKLSSDENLPLAERKIQKQLANSKKIVINGAYGKLGSQYSKIYAPQMMISVCLTGQLSLLMLIERLELNGIQVVSANTDGIVTYSDTTQQDLLKTIVNQWEKNCNFTTEWTNYQALYSANVNNYIAIKSDENCQVKKGVKRKGSFVDYWITSDDNFKMKTTPDFLICRNAVVEFLSNGTPIEDTIKNCTDIRQFLSVRAVRGGGMFRGIPFGRIARFYISTESEDCLQYVSTKNKVPKSDNAMLCLDLPKELPHDIDYQFYIDYADRLFYDLGYKVVNRMGDLFE